MIRSMTGFGRGKYEHEGREYLVEIKSINHKYCDIGIRLPRSFNGLEYKIRQEIASKISRGKIDVFVTAEKISGDAGTLRFNEELAKSYYQYLLKISHNDHR